MASTTAGVAAGASATARSGEASIPSARRLRSVLSVAAATGVANALVYLLYAVLARLLAPSDYGAFAALAAVGLVASVPAIAVQAVVAREVAQRSRPTVDDGVLGLLRWVSRLGVVTAAVVAVTAPGIAHFLHVSLVTPMLLGVWLWPLTVVGGYLGVLLGAGRLSTFGVLLLTSAALRLAGGLAGGAAGSTVGADVAGVMAGLTAGAAATVAVGAHVLRLQPRRHRTVRAESRTRELVTASSGLLSILVLSNVDLVLARHYLPPAEVGLYAAGSIVTKCAFWLPQFVAYAAYRDLARRERGARATRLGLMVVAGIGLITVLATALLPQVVVRVTSGSGYAGTSAYVWEFAALGALLACSQLLVYAGIASARMQVNRLVWAAVVVETAVLASSQHGSIAQILGCALAVNAALVAVATAVSVRRRAAAAAP